MKKKKKKTPNGHANTNELMNVVHFFANPDKEIQKIYQKNKTTPL